MTKINRSRELSPEHHTAFLEAGYSTVFDIIQHSRADFLKAVPGVDAKDARKIYREARYRAESLKSLFRSWQLRQDPILSGLKKMEMPCAAQLEDTLLRNIGDDGDFSELMVRSREYADAASIQSLFSPGRYAASLYKVAKTLHPTSSELHIDKRRPDLKELLLSETNMNQEVTSLDILLEILQKETNNSLENLSKAYFPMTLPYDDNLNQIGCAMSAQGRTLNGVWQTLIESSSPEFTYRKNHTPSRHTGIRAADGDTFYLKSKTNMIYLTHVTKVGEQDTGANLNIGKPSSAIFAVAPLKLTVLDGKYYLGVSGDLTLNNYSLKDCYLKGDDGTDANKDGYFARMANLSAGGINSSRHLGVDIEFYSDNAIKLKTEHGYLGATDGKGDDWKNALTVEASLDDALTFEFYQDDNGTVKIDRPDDLIPLPPAELLTTPSPATRTILALTPQSYALMVQKDFSADDIADHYGLMAAASFAANPDDLLKQLNTIDTFCQKTGLPFNEILELTAQAGYAKTAVDENNSAPYYKYKSTSREDVSKYGAVYLNGGLNDIHTKDDRLLWVQPEIRNAEGTVTTPAQLNFKNTTVTELAGRAEKLVRLKTKTGMTFEMLDWVIANASTAAGFDTPTLDKTVLDALASCVELQQRYGVDTNTLVSFIGAVNPYAKKQEESFYERTLRYPDLTTSIPLGGGVNYVSGNGHYEAAWCKALGVTMDEFSRIGQYCFGSAGKFTISPETAGQVYRFGAIPRMLGLSFAEAECLWQLMGKGQNNLLLSLGRNRGFNAFDIIRRTEQVLGWMADNDLTLIQVQAMVSSQFSATATAEMFTFLQNSYHSVKGTSSASRDFDAALRQKTLRALSGGFGMKTNIMSGVCNWLEGMTTFTLAGYWEDIESVFSRADTSLDILQSNTPLVMNTQCLSQLVLIANWLNLSEQDLMLLVESPQHLNSVLTTIPTPDLPLLQLLTRLKRWQTQVTVSRDEALRLLPYLSGDNATSAIAAEKIAAVHDLNAETVKSMSTALFESKRPWPQSFAQLWQLLTWLRTGEMLNVGTSTLNDLQTMSKNELAAEDAQLIARVALAMSAGIGQR